MEETENNNEKDLTNLDEFQGWEQFSTEDDFFSQAEVKETKSSTDVADVIDEVTKDEDADDITKDEKKSDKEKDKSKDEDLFSSEDIIEQPSEEETTGEESEEEEEVVASPNIATVNLLKDKGLIDFELEEDEKLTEQKAEELIEDKFDEAIENRVKELFDGLPDVVKQINKYAIEGGDVNTFFNSLTKNTSPKITENIDLDNESNQELVIREMLKAEGNDDEEIDTQVEYYKEAGKLEMLAEKKFAKWKKKRKEDQVALVKQQEEASKQQKEALRKAKSKTSEFLSENEEIGGLKFTKEDKRSLPSYMNDRTVKLQNGASISQLQKELFYDLPNNEKAFMQLAVLMKNRNKDGTFNFKSIIKNTETKVVKKVKENVRRSKTSIPTKSKNKKQHSQRSLADYFN